MERDTLFFFFFATLFETKLGKTKSHSFAMEMKKEDSQEMERQRVVESYRILLSDLGVLGAYIRFTFNSVYFV